MRARALVAVSLVLGPCILGAQPRQRLPIGGQPPRAMPSGPQPRVVSEALRYQRLRISMEAYPMVSRVTLPTFGGVPGRSFTSGGTGTRFEYRMARLAAATLDLTTSFLGGPIFNQSAELGFRFGPSRASGDVIPFVDARAGYFYALPNQQLGGFASNPGITFANTMDYSYGPAAIGGGGVEFGVTRRFSVTTAAYYTRADMTARAYNRQVAAPGHYTMSGARFVAALRYNGVRIGNVPTTQSR